jgi:hypothetical protein
MSCSLTPPAADGPTKGQIPPESDSQPGVPPLTIRKDLDVFRDLAPSLLTGFIASMMHQPIF